MNTNILNVIAAAEGLPPATLRIESMIPGRPAVLHDMQDGTTRCLCAVGSTFWLASAAEASEIVQASLANGGAL